MAFLRLLFMLVSTLVVTHAHAQGLPDGERRVFGEMLVIDTGAGWFVTNLVEHPPPPVDADPPADGGEGVPERDIPAWPAIVMLEDGSYQVYDDGSPVSTEELSWAREHGLAEERRYIRAYIDGRTSP